MYVFAGAQTAWSAVVRDYDAHTYMSIRAENETEVGNSLRDNTDHRIFRGPM